MADWVLKVAGHELPCSVPFRKKDILQIEFDKSISIKPGRWGMLVVPDGTTRIVVEIGLPKSPTLIECCLLGTFGPLPLLCLSCGRPLGPNEVIRGVPGMRKGAAPELCAKCWELEAARRMRGSVEELAEDDDEEDVLLDNQDLDLDD